MTIDVEKVAKACLDETSQAWRYGPTRYENTAMARVVLAAVEWKAANNDVDHAKIDTDYLAAVKRLNTAHAALLAALKGGE